MSKSDVDVKFVQGGCLVTDFTVGDHVIMEGLVHIDAAPWNNGEVIGVFPTYTPVHDDVLMIRLSDGRVGNWLSSGWKK